MTVDNDDFGRWLAERRDRNGHHDDQATTQPWERLPIETDKAWEAFEIYLTWRSPEFGEGGSNVGEIHYPAVALVEPS